MSPPVPWTFFRLYISAPMPPLHRKVTSSRLKMMWEQPFSTILWIWASRMRELSQPILPFTMKRAIVSLLVILTSMRCFRVRDVVGTGSLIVSHGFAIIKPFGKLGEREFARLLVEFARGARHRPGRGVGLIEAVGDGLDDRFRVFS